jgi:glucose/arabinose dehydrogenase
VTVRLIGAFAVLAFLGACSRQSPPPIGGGAPASTAGVSATSSATVRTGNASTGVTSIAGFTDPSSIAAPDDGSGRMFVTEQPGLIRVVRDGVLEATPALDIRGKVGSGATEEGLLGLAFPRGFATKRYAYVYFTAPDNASMVYRVRLRGDGTDRFDPATMQFILRVPQPYDNHKGGQLAFGPDGDLYIGLGDGGSEGDPNSVGQNLGTLLAKVLRIDTESTPDKPGYRIPSGNPFVGKIGARPETWVYGLRNPWRFSFDPANGDLYIGDVGQNRYEEVDLVPAGSHGGLDFGWSLYEGDHLYKATRRLAGFARPIAEYSHSEGYAVIGGYVYRGAAYPAMRGLYVFGDYGSGRIWTLTHTTTGWTRRLALRTDYRISTFGVDGSGELWVADRATGTLHRLPDLSR